jgi:protein-S-isoprenylcysteine O-methyltransferase
MDIVVQTLQPLNVFLDKIQRLLSLECLDQHSQFDHPTKAGKVALAGCILGVTWGINVTLLLGISGLLYIKPRPNTDTDITSFVNDSNDSLFPLRLCLLWRWSFYLVSLCTFHLLEFFVTAIYNPTEASSNTFLINHSKAYTAAFMIATSEFWIRFWTFPTLPNKTLTIVGILLVILAQFIRSVAMSTCGESFNHFIQTSKKDNHILVTHGIYSILRHPSYVGFFYYAIGTQVVLHNYISTILFALAGWSFFSRRIPYEERSLIHHFGDAYFQYANRTYVGIPFISNKGLVPSPEEEDTSNSEKRVEELQEEDSRDSCWQEIPAEFYKKDS